MGYFLRYDTTMGGTANINVPQWTGAPNANWSVIVTFIVTSLAASRAFLGRASSAVGGNTLSTAGAINITYFGLNSANGAVSVGTKVRVKIESVGTWKYLSVDTGSGFVQVGSIDYVGANSLIFDRLGRASTYHPHFDFYDIETIGGTYTDKWDSTAAPSTGTTWPSVSGSRNISLTNFTSISDSWWVYYTTTTQQQGVSTFTVSATATTELQGDKIGAASLTVAGNASSVSLGSKIGIVEHSFLASVAASINSNKVGHATIYTEAEAAISVYAGTLYVGEATFSVNAVAGATVQGSKEGSGQIQFQAAAAVYCQAVKVGVATTAIYASAAAEAPASKTGQSEPHAAANAALSIDGYKVGFGSTAVLASVSVTLSSSNPAAVPAPITIVFVRTSSRYKHQLQTPGRYSYLIKTQSGGARV